MINPNQPKPNNKNMVLPVIANLTPPSIMSITGNINEPPLDFFSSILNLFGFYFFRFEKHSNF